MILNELSGGLFQGINLKISTEQMEHYYLTEKQISLKTLKQWIIKNISED